MIERARGGRHRPHGHGRTAGTGQARTVGEHGEGFVRIALAENNHRLRRAVRNIKTFLQTGSNVVEPATLTEAAS
jgi:hypothetical protein